MWFRKLIVRAFALVAVCVVHAQEQGTWSQLGKPSLTSCALVPPGQVVLRWKPISALPPTNDPEMQWHLQKFKILANDTTTNQLTNYSVVPPCTRQSDGTCVEEFPAPEGTEHTESKGRFRQIRVGANKVLHEYRFPRYTLEAGYYSFRLMACFWQPDSLGEHPEVCTDASDASTPLLPVPGHTQDSFTGAENDDPKAQPGVPSWVRAELKGTGGSAGVVVQWGDPVPAQATSFVVLANPNNDTSPEKRFAVSERLYAIKREFTVPLYLLSKACARRPEADQEHHCLFSFQVAAINVDIHGIPSQVSNTLTVPDNEPSVQWVRPGSVRVEELVAQDPEGRVAVSWEYTGASTGFVVDCIKKMTELRACTGVLPPEASSFQFDRATLDNNTWYSFQVRALNLGLSGPASNVTDPVHTAFRQTQIALTPDPIIARAPSVPSPVFAGGQMSVQWEPVQQGLHHRVAYKPHSAGTWEVLTNDTEHPSVLVEGLEHLEVYDFAVAAFNSRGAGPWSPVLRATVGAKHPAAPSQPLKTTHGMRLDRITIGWDKPADGGLPIDEYKVVVLRKGHTQVDLGGFSWVQDKPALGEPVEVRVGRVSEYTMLELEPASSYVFRVAAHNQVGWSALSEPSDLLRTASLKAPSSSYWVKRMKQTLGVCILVFVSVATLCGVCIYCAYKQQKAEGVFEHQPNAWQEFKQMVKGEQDGTTVRMQDRDLL